MATEEFWKWNPQNCTKEYLLLRKCCNGNQSRRIYGKSFKTLEIYKIADYKIVKSLLILRFFLLFLYQNIIMILTFLSLSILHLVFVLFIILLPSVLWIFAIIDILKSNFKDSTNKIIWVLIVLLLPVLGSILYLFWRPTKNKLNERSIYQTRTSSLNKRVELLEEFLPLRKLIF